MLESSKPHSQIGYELTAAPELRSGREALQEFVNFVRRQIALIIFVALIAISLATIYIFTARPSYTAHAQMLIDAHKVQVFQQKAILGDIPLDTAQVESQVEVLKSENVASSVIKNLHLNEDPEFVGSGGGLIGTIFGFIFDTSESNKEASEYALSRRAVNSFESRLSVKRVGLSYVIDLGFESYDAERAAQVANAVADAYIVEQLEAKYQATRRASAWLQDRIKELRDQVTSTERAVVNFKAQNNIVSTGGDKPLVSEQQVAELSSQLVIARSHTAEVKARLDRINSVLKTDAPNDSLDATVADTLKSEIVSKLRSQYLELAGRERLWTTKYGPDHLAVINLRNQMRELRNSIFQELKRLGESYKSDYAIAVQNEDGIQKQLAEAITKSQETDSASVALHELQSTAQTYKVLYDNFLQRYMEAIQQESFPITETRLISSASKPLEPSRPRGFLVLMIASLGGVMLGAALGLMRDLSDRVFRTTEQIERLLLADCIALIPLVKPDEIQQGPSAAVDGKKRRQEKSGLDRQNETAVTGSFRSRISDAVRSATLVSDVEGSIKSATSKLKTYVSSLSDDAKQTGVQPQAARSIRPENERTIVYDKGLIRTVVDAPFSRFAEAIRSIKLAIDLSGPVKVNRTIGLTSSLPGEGKSTLAVALTQLISQVGKRALLIDCDLRNPTLTRQLSPRAKFGLLEVMTEKVALEDAIWTEPSINMAFLPVAMKSRFAHTNEILSSSALKALFERLREVYDYIIVDLPPLAPIVDVRATTHLVDSYVFVVEWGRTKIDVVEHALGQAKTVHENLLGVVLNKVDMDIFGRYTGDQQGYFYNKEYNRYGYNE